MSARPDEGRVEPRVEPLVDVTQRRVAIVMSNAIGDTLVLMVIVRNLLRNGVDVTVFGRPAYALRRWFPDVTIHPMPEQLFDRAWLAPFDVVLQMHVEQPVPMLRTLHHRVFDMDSVIFGDRAGCMAERFADFCRQELALANVGMETGMTPPPLLRHRRHGMRVAIHPEASTEDKRWLPRRFVTLAQRLQRRGYDVHFVIAPHERERWKELEHWGIPAPVFADPHELACWLYESGWFIGNDSGVGHLASCLGVPTLSLFRRRRVSERWRPGWGAGAVVLPWQWVPGASFKEKFWRQTLTCARVESAFHRLVREQQSATGQAAHLAGVTQSS
ncbi:glycosyltransferase family 9 protein [Paraburkholderia sp. BCC1886]|uniref:glycosyltransferase family 9 protein n=1 Tax=Paraburkholderia sp. BCC1886 TaxID=2562670 RepID=UPI0021B4C642|nr:glycosyltransferase family 9 protein [Paraburkholderia sp. BCC1886]